MENMILTAENLRASDFLLDELEANRMPHPQLIYMDPPFYTKRDFGSFSDATGGMTFAQYLKDLEARIRAARDLLAESGSLWLHLDYHAVHYAKVMADDIFGGADHLVNEVIWQYKSGGATKKRFSRKHDSLLFYAKNIKKHKFFPLTEKSYNRGKRPYGFQGVAEYEDEEGWYTIVNMKDVWQIDMVGRTARERTGYATQKPAALLGRILESCTEKGDLCVDFYGGSGTLAAVAHAGGRCWVSIDENPEAAQITEERLTGQNASFITKVI